MDEKQIPYWMALAHMSDWSNEKINRVIIRIIHEKKISMEDFWNASVNDWINQFLIPEEDIFILKDVKKQLPNYSFLAEELLNQGYKVIPISSPEYSNTLKKNLKVRDAPSILYIKGNKHLLQENSIAIIGSKDPSEPVLNFTDKIVKRAIKEGKIVISGFTKGVDLQAINSVVTYEGRCIIVLPQGIMNFSTGFKKYYSSIIKGNILVVSPFYPKASWSKLLAMTRNYIVYGLAEEIYVAEVYEKEDIFSKINYGLTKKKKIFAREPYCNEKNANGLLIGRGAIRLGINGVKISDRIINVSKMRYE
ncbi:MAG: DNA-processing protein DprA [Candidatus Eremiobacterota bacterium]